MVYSKVFEPIQLGPITLRNRTIRAAAFEGMCKHWNITHDLINYHRKVAEGGIGMTTVAYASVSKDGLAFTHQLWIREEIKSDLKKLTDAIHAGGAKASIQIGHTGNMSKKSVTGFRPISASAKFNLYGPTWPRKMTRNDIQRVVNDFKHAALILNECGFDAVEIHAGHGYLISQFLSPYTNRRNDEYGGSFENRSRFLREVLTAVREAVGNQMAILVKMNMWDGFEGGITQKEAYKTAQIIESLGADAIVLSGGFVSKAPMYIMRGRMPTRIMAKNISNIVVKFLVGVMGQKLIKPYPFQEGYFIEEAKKFRDLVKIPLIYVGGMNSIETIEKAFQNGADCVAFARALIQNPSFVNDLRNEIIKKSGCTICNYCVAVMYTGKMRCFMNEANLSPSLREQLAHPER
ncbi:MAG: NADH:flavin oxidoreductase [Flavobacteriales bacterium]|nr:NADH:flavin oxidoreductase [Flavobacteriales bacterium]